MTRRTMLIRITLYSLGAGLFAAGLFLAKLAYPGTPSKGTSLDFAGYIELPKGAALNVLDYITVSGDALFVTSESNGAVYRVDLHQDASVENAEVHTFSGEGATHGVVIDPVSGLAYVTRSEVNTVDVFNPETLTLTKHIPVAEDPDGIFYDPANKLIYVASGDAKLATVIEPTRQETVATIHLSGKPEFAAFDNKTGYFYQNLADNDTLAAVDARARSVVHEWPLAACKGPSAMAIDTADRRLFVACSQNAQLLIVDLDSHRAIDSVAVGGGPDAVAYDPVLHRLYIAGKSGWLTVVRQDTPDRYKIIDSIHTHYGAHTLALNPATHRVYVGYASLFAAPRLAVFTPKT